MKLLLCLIKKFYIGRTAYALNSIENNGTTFYNIEKVIIEDITINRLYIHYFVKDYKTFDKWGDTTEHWSLTKRGIYKQLIKLCKL